MNFQDDTSVGSPPAETPLRARLAAMGARLSRSLGTVLQALPGAPLGPADLARAVSSPVEIDFMHRTAPMSFFTGLEASGVALPEPNFLNQVSLDFGVAAPEQHYHVPLLLSPYGYSTYRGS